MAILKGDHHAEARAAVSVDLGKDKLPDATIDLDIYKGSAEREVIGLVPDAESKTGDDAAVIRTAAIYLTAARLCPAVARTISIQMSNGQQSYTRSPFKPEERAAELREMAYSELQPYIQTNASSPTEAPVFFTLATGRRGR